MSGVITKRDFFRIWIEFGFKKALKVLTSKHPVALIILMS